MVCRAMELSRGTVSVVDSNGVTWTRVWCKLGSSSCLERPVVCGRCIRALLFVGRAPAQQQQHMVLKYGGRVYV